MSRLITINFGSSNVKAKIYDVSDSRQLSEADKFSVPYTGAGSENELMEHLRQASGGHEILAIGHRLVHGGPNYSDTIQITGSIMQDLAQLAAFDPDHTPYALQLIELCAQVFTGTAQYACFDTAFFSDMPDIAKLLPLPRKYQQEGLRRYGFHGLSYTYLQQAFKNLAGEAAVNGRVIYAHLGSGASLAATKDGKPVDTTMAFTPASGIVMSSRSGDLDPGISWYLNRRYNVGPEEFNRMVNLESGLLGVSGLSADMKELLDSEQGNSQAAAAVELFCYRAAQAAGALAASIGGLDSLVFSGGIGEQSYDIRQRISSRLAFLGIELDDGRNRAHESLISADSSRVGVHAIPTDEAFIVATEVIAKLSGQGSG